MSPRVASDKCKLNWIKPIKQKSFSQEGFIMKRKWEKESSLSEDSNATCNGCKKQGPGLMDIILRLQFPSAVCAPMVKKAQLLLVSLPLQDMV